MPTLGNGQLRSLAHLRNQYGPTAARQRKTLLAECASRDLANPRTALRYHDALLFHVAYPDDRAVAERVDAELARIAEAMPTLLRIKGAGKILGNSGIANTVIDSGYSIELLEWLIDRFPDQVRLAWQSGEVGENLDDLLALTLLPVERDGMLLPRFDMQRWTRFSIGRDASGRQDLPRVLARLRTLVPDREALDLVLEHADLRVRWQLTTSGPSRTLGRFPPRASFCQRTAPKRQFDVKRLLSRPLPAATVLGGSRAQDLIDVARGTLAVRIREADPITYANPAEVTFVPLDRGIDIALFGLLPTQRLPVESYFGFMAARNRIPIAYGGAWVFGRRAEIGVHLFQSFRGGESAYLFGQVLRTYHQHYGVHRFRVDPYQFGAGNPEAIRAGAFWFYYRFGFRPVNPTLRKLAEDEASRIAATRGHRTPAAILRRFTKSALTLDRTPRGALPDDPPELTALGVAVTHAMNERFGDDRDAAARWARQRVARLLEPGRMNGWAPTEKAAYEQLCPLVAILPDVTSWSARDRQALVRLMRAKGGSRERLYTQHVQRHPRLRAALREIVDTIDWSVIPRSPPPRII